MTYKTRAHEFAQEHIESGEWMAVIPPLAALLAEVAAEARRSERDEVLSAASCVDAMALAKARAEGRRQGLESIDGMLAKMAAIAFDHHRANPGEQWWLGQGQGVEAARAAIADALAKGEP